MATNNMLYLQIREYLLDLINQHKNTPGYVLPSENQLAQKFKASRISAKHAYETLEKENLVIRQRGRGTFIANAISTSPTIPYSSIRKLPDVNPVAIILPFVNSVFMCELLAGMQKELNRKEIPFVLYLTGNNQEKETQCLQQALKNCSGILFFPGAFSKYTQEILELVINHFPLVQLDRHLSGLDLSFVSCDHYNATYHAVQFLLQQGYRKIGYVTHPTPHASSIADRLAGFHDAIKDFNPQYPGNFTLTAKANTSNFQKLFTEYIHQVQPEVIISSNVNFHSLIMHTLKDMRMDQKIDLMFFDNIFQDLQDYVSYHPYIIDQQPQEIGRTAVNLLYRLIYENIAPTSILIPEKIYQI